MATPWARLSRGTLLRAVAAAGFTSLAVALAAALWARKRRREARRAARSLAGPSLADEIREALQREAAEGEQRDPRLEAHFVGASSWVSSPSADGLSTKVKLDLYGWYKQALCGDCPPARPRDMKASMKWEAWHEHIGVKRSEAMQNYIAVLNNAVPAWSTAAAAANVAPAKPSSECFGPAVSTMGQIGDPDHADDVDETPIGQLCEKIASGNDDVVGILRESPALAFKADKDGMTPLHWAADRGNVKAVQYLCGADSGDQEHINARDHSGDTPLHYAVLTENLEVAQLLVSHGARLHAENDEGETPASLAEAAGWDVALLEGGPGP